MYYDICIMTHIYDICDTHILAIIYSFIGTVVCACQSDFLVFSRNVFVFILFSCIFELSITLQTQ